MKLTNTVVVVILIFIMPSCKKVDREEILRKERTQELLLYPKDFKEMKIFAHRGHWNTEGSFENTLSSIINADKIGVHGVELDVRISADSVLYLYHDPNVTNGRLFADMPSTEIDKIVLPNGDNIPRLDTALNLLKEFPNLQVNLEIKSDMPVKFLSIILHKLYHSVNRSGLQKRVFYSSYSMGMLSNIKKYNPNIKTQYLAYSDFDIQKALDAKVNMINYRYSLLVENPNLIDIANSHNIEVSTGLSHFVSVIDLVDKNWNVKMVNTDEPHHVMQVYKY